MKLDKLNKRDYPKLQAERVLRKNPNSPLHALPVKSDKLSDSFRRSIANGRGYEPRIRPPEEATPRQNDWRGTVHDPKTWVDSSAGLAKWS